MSDLKRIRPLSPLLLLAVLALAACATGNRVPAPVEDRGLMVRNRPAAAPVPAPAASSAVRAATAQAASGPASSQPSSSAPANSSQPSSAVQARPQPAPQNDTAAALPGAENAGKPGYYTVRPGDTLLRIALDSGQNWRDLVRWNTLPNPNLLEVGQVLRVVPPAGSLAASEVVTRPVQTATINAVPTPSGAAAASPSPSPARQPEPANASPSAPEDEIVWAWPAPGNPSLLAGFDEVRNKGFDIGGKAGDPVLAAADGRVVYAGSGLRGYGNLVILKHNNTYLTAYAHNQSLVVKEDQTVRKGQKIAEMGATDADRVKLHFEIRRQGKPVDPAKYLTTR